MQPIPPVGMPLPVDGEDIVPLPLPRPLEAAQGPQDLQASELALRVGLQAEQEGAQRHPLPASPALLMINGPENIGDRFLRALPVPHQGPEGDGGEVFRRWFGGRQGDRNQQNQGKQQGKDKRPAPGR
jgi:hypothetical protein